MGPDNGTARQVRLAVAIFAAVCLGDCTDDHVGPPSPPAANVQIGLDTVTIMSGQALQLTASVSDAGGTGLHGRVVVWRSQNDSVASVSSTGLVSGVALGRVAITATVEGYSDTAVVTVLSAVLASVTVSPDSVDLLSDGTLQLTATLRDVAGHTLVGGPVTWVTRDPSVATVSSAGVVTGVGVGRDTIAASSGGVTGFAVLTVAGSGIVTQSGVTVSDLAPRPTAEATEGIAGGAMVPARAAMAADSVSYVALSPGTVAGGVTAEVFNPITGSLVKATMTAGGLDPVPVIARDGDMVTVVTTDGAGARVTYRMPVYAKVPPVVVRGHPPRKRTDVPLNSVMAFVFSEPVDPQSVSTQTVQLVKNGQLVPGHPVLQPGGLRVDFIPDAPLAPNSDYTLLVTPAVRDLHGQPLEQAEISTFTTGTATPLVRFVLVSPPSAVIVTSAAIQLTATPTAGMTSSADTIVRPGDPIIAGPASWVSSDPSVAVVSANGLVTAAASGQASISATVDGITGSAIIQVVPPTSLDVDGVWDWTEQIVATSFTCNDTGSYNFTQVGVTFSGQSQQVGGCRAAGDNIRTDPVSGGVISGNSITFGVGGGACSYTAQATGVPASNLSGSITCNDGSASTWRATRQEPVASVAVVPATLTLLPGITVPVKAALSDVQGNRVFFRTVTWSSDQSSVASIAVTSGDSNKVTTVAPGSATITASAGGKSGAAAVTVLVPVVTVSVSPAPDTIGPGATVQLVATPRDAAGNLLLGRTVYWSIDNSTVATVSATGVVTGAAAGTTSVHAGVDGVWGLAEITVTGTPIAIAGEWTFREDIYGGNYEDYSYYLCSDSGSVVLSQDGFAVSGTMAPVGACLGQSPQPVTGGRLSGRILDFAAGNCAYSVLVSGTPADQMSLQFGGGSGITCPGDPNNFVTSFSAVRVGPAAALAVEPSATSLVIGASTQLHATITDAAGHTLYGRAVTWSSDDPGVATVTDSGAVTAVAPGSAMITATGAGVGGTAPITVITVSFSSISAGDATTCALTSGGAAYCWGYNGTGELGDGTTLSSRSVPTAVVGGITFGSVAAGEHACGLAPGGVAYCWGNNSIGQLGNGSVGGISVPTQVTGGLSFVSVGVGGGDTCGLSATGAAYCWGANRFGQLGDGDATADRTAPTPVVGGMVFAMLSVGGTHTCGLTAAGLAYCWGWNPFGELGDNTTIDRSTPVAVVGGLAFVSISAGNSHTCALTQTGVTYCWGSDYADQLGVDTRDTCTPSFAGGTSYPCSRTPLAIAGGLSFATVTAAEGDHTCGLTSAGDAYCWGRNASGELGDGTTTNEPTPTPVDGGLQFTHLAAGGAHTCGITLSGVTYCWGNNAYYQLGDGTTTNRSVPMKVAGQP